MRLRSTVKGMFGGTVDDPRFSGALRQAMREAGFLAKLGLIVVAVGLKIEAMKGGVK